jgi:hypothetical protein
VSARKCDGCRRRADTEPVRVWEDALGVWVLRRFCPSCRAGKGGPWVVTTCGTCGVLLAWPRALGRAVTLPCPNPNCRGQVRAPAVG